MDERFEHGYALLIGVSENALERLALPTVGQDVEAVRRVLIHPQRCAYPPENVQVLAGPQATRAGILDGLSWLQERIQADGSGNATAVLYYSGHGWRDESADPPQFFLVPYDMVENRFRSSALRAQDFGEAVSALQARRLLVILDCCHAGGMEAKELSLAPSGFVEAAIAPHLLLSTEGALPSGKALDGLAQGDGRAVLSSSKGEQKSYVRRDGAMSIFTYHLVEALTGHAQPQQGADEVLVSDMMGHVTRHVPPSARAEWGAEQQPDDRVVGNFPIALLLGGKGLGEGRPAPDPLSLFEAGAGPTTITARDITMTSARDIGTGAIVVTGSGNVVYSAGTSPGTPAVDPSAPRSRPEGQDAEGEA